MSQPRQITRHVLMMRPRCFGPNTETAATNVFQYAECGDPSVVQANAAAEFEVAVNSLNAAGVDVIVAEDTAEPPKPDAIFPNNWVSSHEDGTVVLYPLQARNRRAERRADIIDELACRHGFSIARIVDLSPMERDGLFLEGTGSMVIDHRQRVAYAALSERTHEAVLIEFGRCLDMDIVSFRTRTLSGRPLYHTNVMMSIGMGFTVICAEAIASSQERAMVLDRLAASGLDIITIGASQLRSFAGNVLHLQTSGSRPVLAISAAAAAVLEPGQKLALAAYADLLPLSVPTIERVGGGSVRCMLAEVFLPGPGVRHSPGRGF